MTKKQKLSDEVVASLWGKKKKTVRIGNKKICWDDRIFPKLSKATIKVLSKPLKRSNKVISPALTITKLIDKFEKETGKNAIWHNKITKQFLNWKFKLIANEIENN